MARFTWPAGKQCAVALTFDGDGETIPLVRDREHGHEKLTLIPSAAYGPAVGVPRILDVLEAFGLKGTFFIPGFTAELHPDMVRRLVAEGHEVGHHGYLHERPNTLSDAEEAVLIRGLEALSPLIGDNPIGYRSPAWELKLSSPGLLRRHGFRYDSSLMGNDIPYLVSTPAGPLLELPVQWILDDAPQFSMTSGGGISSPEMVFEVWSTEFAGYHRFNGCYVLTMHPFVSGRPSRIMLLERMIRSIQQFENVWWATLAEIGDF